MCETHFSLTEGVNMKHIIYITISALALSNCAMAHADTWTMPNNAGGQIVLSDRVCSDKYPKLLQMYTRGSDGVTLDGCWAYYDGYIHVVYDDKSQRTYDPKDFIKMQNY